MYEENGFASFGKQSNSMKNDGATIYTFEMYADTIVNNYYSKGFIILDLLGNIAGLFQLLIAIMGFIVMPYV